MTPDQLVKKILGLNVPQVVPTVRRFCDDDTSEVLTAYGLCQTHLSTLTASAPMVRTKLMKAVVELDEWLSREDIAHDAPITASGHNESGGRLRPIRSDDTRAWKQYAPLANPDILASHPVSESDSAFKATMWRLRKVPRL